ncbi:aminoglycoside phosphotransferase family protein [Zafaria sp. Z1313]|uniref:aminoglycoside phosphotransferase family protein n=1 Tax=Zafaria sp. Z1313 TaxID=3423202 RepID=UPI003D302147
MSAPPPLPDPHALPAVLRRNALRLRGGRSWLDALPDHFRALLERWRLVHDPADAPWWAGHAGVVVPVRDAAGTPLALKVSLPEEDLRAEAWALRAWGGRGAVGLVQDDGGFSLLLERLVPGPGLGLLPVEESVPVWGGIVRTLAVGEEDGWPRFERTSDVAERLGDGLPQDWFELDRPVPRALLQAALERCQERGTLALRGGRPVLVHGDLHYFNVLARPAGGFAAIDPQPYLGDAEFSVLPMLHNRLAELPARNQGPALEARMRALCAAAGLDVERARGWSIARAVEDVLWFTRHGLPGDAERSLWVATALAGLPLDNLPRAEQLAPLA